GERASLPGLIVKVIEHHLSEEPNYLAQYQEEARNGREVIAVKVEGQQQVQAVAEIMERYGARNVRHFGALAVADLTPMSNPSKPSDQSPENRPQAKAS